MGAGHDQNNITPNRLTLLVRVRRLSLGHPTMREGFFARTIPKVPLEGTHITGAAPASSPARVRHISERSPAPERAEDFRIRNTVGSLAVGPGRHRIAVR